MAYLGIVLSVTFFLKPAAEFWTLAILVTTTTSLTGNPRWALSIAVLLVLAPAALCAQKNLTKR